MSSIASFDNVSLERGDRSIFKDLSLDIPDGKITAIMGPSGCGKTTLLRLLGRQLQPSAGRVTLFGQKLDELSASEILGVRKRIGVLFQNGALFNHTPQPSQNAPNSKRAYGRGPNQSRWRKVMRPLVRS